MKTITIYTSPTCGFCRALKDYLKQRNILFEEKDIIAHPDNFSEMQRYAPNVMSVPVTVFDKDKSSQEILIGFDVTRVSQILGL